MMIVSNTKHDFAHYFYPRLSEWAAAFVFVMIGVILLHNDTLMATTTSNSFKMLLSIANQDVWAFTFSLFGTVRLLILMINGMWRRSPHLRAMFAMFACFLWVQVTLSFMATFGFAFALAAGYLAMDLFNIIRASQDARTVDDAFSGESASGSK